MKKSVLFISHSQSLNGAEICLLTLLRHLDQDRFQPFVILPGEGILRDEIDKLGIASYIIPLNRWIRFSGDKFSGFDLNATTQAIADIILANRIDIVHTNTSIIYEGALAARVCNVPHIWHMHETLVGHPELTPLLPLPLTLWGMSYLSDQIVTVAESLKQQFQDVKINAKLRNIHNGIDTRLFTSWDDIDIREELGLRPDDILLVTVGGLTERKGFPVLLKVASAIKHSGKRAQFLWVGHATESALISLNDQVAALDIADIFTYLNFRNDIAKILQGADIYVLPSVNEAFPMVILEAMAAGKPVIATDCGGVRESVEDGETGYVVPVNDVEYLSQKVQELIGDREKREEFGRRALERFNLDFKAEVFAARFQELYEEVIANPRKEDLVHSDLEKLLYDSSIQVYQRFCEALSKLSVRDTELVASHHKLNESLHQCTLAQDRIVQLGHELSEKCHQLIDKEKELADKGNQLTVRDQQLRELLESYSWKITRPLRWILDQLHGL